MASMLLVSFLCPAGTPSDAMIGKAAPVFVRTGLNGEHIDLGALRGKVVVLNFWASWCAPCLSEMPRFATWQKKFGTERLQVVGISMDEDAEAVHKVGYKLGVNYPILMGDVELGHLYGGILGLPVTYLIDRQGIVRYRWQGESNLDAMETALRGLVERP